MKVFVTGVNGQLGHDVMIELAKRGYEGIGSDLLPKDNELSYVPLDITNSADVQKTIQQIQPDAVVHCAAWTAVDLAEDNIEKVRKVNVDGTRNIAEVCKEVGAKMIYISTDYVFDGKGTKEFDINEPKNGLSVYGKTKSSPFDFVLP